MGHFIREVLLALLFLVGSCFVRLDGQDSLPMPLLKIAQPEIARAAWIWDLACSGLQPKFPLDSVHWFAAELSKYTEPHPAAGEWAIRVNNREDSLSITLDLSVVNDFGTVAHELMHYIRQTGGHPDEYFQKCRI